MKRFFRKVGLCIAPRRMMMGYMEGRCFGPYMPMLVSHIMVRWLMGDSVTDVAQAIGCTEKIVKSMIEYHKTRYLNS